MPGKIKDRTGQRYGKLVALRLDHVRTLPTGKSHPYWLCQCDCGRQKAVGGTYLQKGNIKTCGCSWVLTPGSRKHGRHNDPLYNTWRGMKDRCQNPSHQSFHNYGGKGVKICDAWQSFEGFAAHFGSRPEGKTLDRIDSSGDYCPENCRWATPKEQARNLKHTILVPHDGGVVSLSEYARIHAVNPMTLWHRVRRQNQDPVTAAADLKRQYPPHHRSSAPAAAS